MPRTLIFIIGAALALPVAHFMFGDSGSTSSLAMITVFALSAGAVGALITDAAQRERGRNRSTPTY